MSERPVDDWSDPLEVPLEGPLEAFYRYAESGRGTPLLCGVALAESLGVPLPADVLLAGFCIGAPSRTKRFVGACLLAAVIGGAITYAIAPKMWEDPGVRAAVDQYLGPAGYTNEGLRKINSGYQRHGWWAVLVSGLKPASYHRHAFSAGVFHDEQPFVPFVFASCVSHALRFLLVGGIAAFFADLLRPATARRPKRTFLIAFLLWVVFSSWGLYG